VRRHLLPPGTIRRDPPPAPARRDRCWHGSDRPCPWPGCQHGVAGAQIVTCGPEEVTYLERERYELEEKGVVFVRWRWRIARRVQVGAAAGEGRETG
jgi:hypothetical protein